MYRLCGKPKLTDPKWAREAFPDLERCRLRASESPSASRRGATGVCVPVCGRGEVCSPAAGGGLWGATSCRAQHMLALGDGQGLCTEKEAGCVLGQGGRLHPRCPPPVPIPGTRPWCPSPVPVPGARPRCPSAVPASGARPRSCLVPLGLREEDADFSFLQQEPGLLLDSLLLPTPW